MLPNIRKYTLETQLAIYRINQGVKLGRPKVNPASSRTKGLNKGPLLRLGHATTRVAYIHPFQSPKYSINQKAIYQSITLTLVVEAADPSA